jgi:hypothetical protein
MFDELALRHPDKLFTWVDIEDQAHLIDELDIENFPTILIQHHETCLFIGTMLPDTHLLHRLILSLETNENTQATPTSLSKLKWSLRERLSNSKPTWTNSTLLPKAAWKSRGFFHGLLVEPIMKKGTRFSSSPFNLVRLAGIEPTTPWFVAKYSIQLSYSREEQEYSWAQAKMKAPELINLKQLLN